MVTMYGLNLKSYLKMILTTSILFTILTVAAVGCIFNAYSFEIKVKGRDAPRIYPNCLTNKLCSINFHPYFITQELMDQ